MKSLFIFILVLSFFSCKKIETPAIEDSNIKVSTYDSNKGTFDLPNAESGQGLFDATMSSSGPDGGQSPSPEGHPQGSSGLSSPQSTQGGPSSPPASTPPNSGGGGQVTGGG